MEKITVIIPVYNVEKYLERCIKSVLGQTYRKIEIILVDDGSIDSSGKICDRYQELYHNIAVIHKKNEGLGLARNTGLKLSTGKYVTFIDSDDYIMENHIENLYNCIKENDCDVCYAGHSKVYIDKTVDFPNIFAGRTYNNKTIVSKIVPRICGQSGSINDSIQMSVCMSLYRVDIIERQRIEFLSESVFISEDLLFNLDYLKYANSVCFSSDIGYKYFFNKKSLSHKYRKDRFDKNKKMLDEMSKRTKELGVYKLCEQRIFNTFIIQTRITLQAEQENSKSIGNKNAFLIFKTYLNDDILQEVLRKFNNVNVNTLPKIINIFMKYRMSRTLWFVMIIRNRYKI